MHTSSLVKIHSHLLKLSSGNIVRKQNYGRTDVRTNGRTDTKTTNVMPSYPASIVWRGIKRGLGCGQGWDGVVRSGMRNFTLLSMKQSKSVSKNVFLLTPIGDTKEINATQKRGFDVNKTICMKCRNLFSRINKYNIIC